MEEGGAFSTVATGRKGGVSDQDVDLTCLQSREALLGCEGNVLDRLRVSEYRRGDRFAEIDIESGQSAVRVTETEARNRFVDAAQETSPGLHVPE